MDDVESLAKATLNYLYSLNDMPYFKLDGLEPICLVLVEVMKGNVFNLVVASLL